jgi:hypothetical protein
MTIQPNPRPRGIFVPKVEPLIGFAAKDSLPGQQALVVKRAIYTSDDPTFYKLINGLNKALFAHLKQPLDPISLVLVLLHKDGSAHLYVNEEVGLSIEARIRTSVEQGQPVSLGSIVDIGPMKILDVEIQETDNVVLCFKVDWKFGLFFDFDEDRAKRPLNKGAMWATLGSVYRLLKFGGVFSALEQVPLFDKMTSDGWFPFQDFLQGEWDELVGIYKSDFDQPNRLEKLCKRYDQDRLRAITEKWWRNPIFVGKRSILEAGVRGYLAATPDGYVCAIKTLYSETEGLLRAAFLKKHGRKVRDQGELLDNLSLEVAAVAGHETSLFLPRVFSQFIKEVVFAHFDETKDVPLSRHSVAHGVARSDCYTQSRALQAILIVDQLFYFL